MTEIQKIPEQKAKGLKEQKQTYLCIPLLFDILLSTFSHLIGIEAIKYFSPNIINESVDSAERSFLGAILVRDVNCAFISLSGVGLFFFALGLLM